jgi:hypothetical protein
MTALRSVLCISTFASLIAVPMLLSGAQASTTTRLLSCQANSRQQVIDCCESVLRTEQRPYWMVSGRNGCTAAVACSGRGNYGTKALSAALVKAPKRCAMYIPGIEEKSNDPQRESSSRNSQSRGKD